MERKRERQRESLLCSLAYFLVYLMKLIDPSSSSAKFCRSESLHSVENG